MKSKERKYKKNIIWVKNSSLQPLDQLPDGHHARVIFLSNDEVVIIIKNYPCSKEDSSLIAHELAHLVLDEEGYPQIGHNHKYDGNYQIETFAFRFNTSIQDILVIKKLLLYGFNLKEEYLIECKESLHRIKSLKIPNNKEGQFLLAIWYLYIVLENQLIFKEEKTECLDNIIIDFSEGNYVKGVEIQNASKRFGVSKYSLRKVPKIDIDLNIPSEKIELNIGLTLKIRNKSVPKVTLAADINEFNIPAGTMVMSCGVC